MKLTTIILLATVLQVSARTEAQTVNLVSKSISLEKVFSEIEKQTGYVFFYDVNDLSGLPNVSVSFNNTSLTVALDASFKGLPLKYNIQGKTIFVTKVLKGKGVDEDDDSPPPPPLIDVTGKVVDSTGKPIAGASVKLLPGGKGTITNLDGDFLINEVQPGNYTVEILFVGYEVRTLKINVGESSLNLQQLALSPKVIELDDVTVSTGYWTTAKKMSTGSISKITAKTIEKQPITNPLQAMQGRMSGIYIGQTTGVPGGNFQVRIRGTNSIQNGNNPLYIIDGVPFISESISDVLTSGNLYGPAGLSPLNSINPYDIESIEVLKDADATSIYGSRGANGVILINTKKGKAGKMTFSLNLRSGISKVTSSVQLLNTEQYITMRSEAVQNDGAISPGMGEYDINGAWSQKRYTDWQRVLIGGSAKMVDINATLSGGNNETQVLFNVGYNDQGTVFPGDNTAKKISTHFSVSHSSPNKRFLATLSSGYTVNKTNIVGFDLTQTSLELPPNAPELYEPDGDLNWEKLPSGKSTWYNPLVELQNRFNSNTDNLLINADIGYKISKNLRFKSNLGFSTIRLDNRKKYPVSGTDPTLNYLPSSFSNLIMGSGWTRSFIAEPQLNWTSRILKGKFDVLLGSTYHNKISESRLETFKGFPSDALLDDPRSASIFTLNSYSYTEYRYAALYARFNYNWDEKYILNFTGRSDGSSRFGPGKRVANLGAIGLAWIFSKENFNKGENSILSFGKIRGSYGYTGNDQIGDYRYLDAFRAGVPYQDMASLVRTQLFNPDYGWETNRKLEAAVEMGFFKDRISLLIAYYRNQSSNQLIDYKLAATTGFSSVLQNFPATIRNSGLEVELEVVNIYKPGFRWSTSINASFPRNKLIAFPGLESSSYANSYILGEPLNIRRVYHYLGVDPASGVYKFKDINSDGQFTPEDKTSFIEIGQTCFGGVDNRLIIKGFQVDVFFQFVKQRGVLFTSIGEAPGVNKTNQPVSILEGRWQKPGDNATYQFFSRSVAMRASQSLFASSDGVAGDISFARLKTVSISYDLSDKVFPEIKGRLYLQGQNLLSLSSYSGLDAETGAYYLPPLTSIVVGMQLTF